MPVASPLQIQAPPRRHTALVRITHWITVLSFLALLVTGIEITISHPRFYWGETGNSGTRPLFQIPIPASRDSVPTGYTYTLPDQNGWSRYLHFESAWVLVLTGLIYVAAGLLTAHFRRNLLPAPAERTPRTFLAAFARALRRSPPDADTNSTYNTVQRTAYLTVIFVLFPLVILTGLALSPGFNAAFPLAVNLLGGRQSARTLHFFLTLAISAFVVVHIAMIAFAGFWTRTRAMITGRTTTSTERP